MELVPSEKLARPVVIEDFPALGHAASTIIPALLAVLASFRSLLGSRAALQAELSATRYVACTKPMMPSAHALPDIESLCAGSAWTGTCA